MWNVLTTKKKLLILYKSVGKDKTLSNCNNRSWLFPYIGDGLIWCVNDYLKIKQYPVSVNDVDVQSEKEISCCWFC